MAKKKKRSTGQRPADRGASERLSRRERQLAKQKAAQRQRTLWLASVGLIIVVLIGFGIYRTVTAPDIGEAIAEANRIGPESAPVQIVEFADFGCPACRTVHNLGVIDQILEKYGDQVSFTFRHFPVITPRSPLAAAASQCAAAQGRFWEYHDYLYEVVPPGSLAEPDLKQHAAAIGLETGAFDQCLESGIYEAYVATDQQAARAAGARGTPSFFINGEATSPDVNLMSAQIDSILGN